MKHITLFFTLSALIFAGSASAQVKKSGGLFGFGKDETQPSSALFPTQGPVASPVTETADTPVFKTTGSAPVPAPVVTTNTTEMPAATTATAAVPAIDPAATVNGKVEKKGGFRLPFMGRSEEPAPASPVLTPVPAPTPNPVATTTPPPAPSASAPGAASTGTAPAADVPQFAGSPAPTPLAAPEEKKDGILSKIPSLPKVSLPKRNVTYSGTEVIIQNGQIVEAADNSFQTSSSATANGKPATEAQIVDGVTTYSSWGDVQAGSSSAADKILNQLR
jgi:hypothetical protein